MYKAIIIGCGKIAGFFDTDDMGYVYSHAHAYKNNPDIEIVCCVDINIHKAKELAKKYNCSDVEKDFVEALNRHKSDIVSVCTPDEIHYDIVVGILSNDITPKIIYLEKPVCGNINELNKMVSLSDQKKVEIVVNHTRRFDSNHRYLKKLIAQKKFGNLVRGDIFYYSGWEHNGIHVIDTLNYLFNNQIIIKKIYSKKESPYPDDPTLDLSLSFRDSQADIYLHSIDEKYYQLFEFDLKFEKARLKIEDFGNRIIYEKKIINEMRENVLAVDQLDFPENNLSPMQTAINLISDYLRVNDVRLLEGHRISDIANTMKTIWKGEHEHKNKFR